MKKISISDNLSSLGKRLYGGCTGERETDSDNEYELQTLSSNRLSNGVGGGGGNNNNNNNNNNNINLNHSNSSILLRKSSDSLLRHSGGGVGGDVRHHRSHSSGGHSRSNSNDQVFDPSYQPPNVFIFSNEITGDSIQTGSNNYLDTLVENQRIKDQIQRELLENLDIFENVKDIGEICSFCECSLLYNHLNIANLIITSNYLLFLPQQQVQKGFSLESYLNKKGDYFWKKYWFVLTHDSISWYKNSVLKETHYPSGTILLMKIVSIEKLSQDESGKPFTLQIMTSSQVYLLQADSEVQLDQWYQEITRVQKNLTVLFPLSDIVSITMETDAALFFDSLCITLKRSENCLITPTSNSNEIYQLLVKLWNVNRGLQNKEPEKQQIQNEFQQKFKLTHPVEVVLGVPHCLYYRDIEISFEGTLYATKEGLYFTSGGNNNSNGNSNATSIILLVQDITSIIIDLKSESPETIIVYSHLYDNEPFYFDIFTEPEHFFNTIVEEFLKINNSIFTNKYGELPPNKLEQQSPPTKRESRLILSRLPSLPSLPSISIPLFKSKSSSNINLNSNNNTNINNNNLNINVNSNESNSNTHLNLAFHHIFPLLPLDEPVLLSQNCTLYFFTLDSKVEGHVYVTKSYIAFSPKENDNPKYKKALIPFEDIVSIHKERFAMIFSTHCVKIQTLDSKWIFGSLNNFIGFYNICHETWRSVPPLSNEGQNQIFTPLEAVRIKEKFGLPNDENLITWFNCTNLKGAQLKYGFIYITNHHLCFRSKLGFQKRNIVIPFNVITEIKKYSVLIPNGIKITTNNQVDFQFASFIHRKQAYRIMTDIWKKNKRLSKNVSPISITPPLASGTTPLLSHPIKPIIPPLSINTPNILTPNGITPPILSPSSNSVTTPNISSGNLTSSPLSISLPMIPPASMKITILTIGSRGDIQPFIALALELKSQGHNITLASHEVYRNLITQDYNLQFAPLGGDPKDLMDLCVRNGIFTPKFIKEALSRFRSFIDDLLKTCWEASKGAEALIATPGCFAGPHIAEALQIPFFNSFTMPFTRTRMYPNPFAPFASRQMGGVFNLATHVMMEKILWQPISGQINQWRVETLKIPSWNSSVSITETYRIPYLYCFSRFLVPKPPDWPGEVCISGYWLLNQNSNQQPDQNLMDFLDAGEAPIYLGFGSIVIEDPQSLTNILIDAIRITGKRAIISQGWGGLKISIDQMKDPNHQDQQQIYLLEKPVDHSWLFERVSLVVHHGGAGTTAAGIYANKPTIIVPFFGDQFFWGERIKQIGIGHSIPFSTLTVKSLASTITSALSDSSMKALVIQISENLKKEDGIKEAISSFFRYLPVAYIPPRLKPFSQKTNCHLCKESFSLIQGLLSKVHCHHCGNVFCESCASNKIAIKKYRMVTPVRVCNTCYQSLNQNILLP